MAHVQDLWYSPGPDGGDAPTARHGRGKRWKARYLDPDGQERSRSFARKADADKFLTEVEHSKIAGSYLDPDAGRLTLRKHAGQWLSSRTHDPTTNNSIRQRVNKHILPVLGDKRLDQLARSPGTVQAWMAGLGVAASYARQLLGILSAILDAAVADGLIPRNPCRDVTVRAPRAAKRKVVPLTAPQAAAVRAAMPERYQAMADCGTDLGMRQGEIFGLPVDEIDFLRRVVHIRVQVKQANGVRPVFAAPKGGKERDVPLPGSTAAALAEHIRQFPPREVTLPWRTLDGKPRTCRLVFTGVRGRAVDRWSFNRDVWKPALRAAGIPIKRENGMHVLRHTYASVLLRGGIDIRRLAAYLGHSNASITLATYSHLIPDDEERSLRQIEDALAGDQATPIVQQTTDVYTAEHGDRADDPAGQADAHRVGGEADCGDSGS